MGTSALAQQLTRLRVVLVSAFVLRISDLPAEQGPIVLRDVSRETGIAFQHTDGSSGRHYLVEYVASGLATFDCDADGRIDIYFLNGRPLPGAKADVPPRNHLYRNLDGLRFSDATDRAGVGDAGYGVGVAVGDYDNDGRPDLYVNNFGPNVLYLNQGDGTFADVTARAGVARGDTVGAGANFLDIDADGELDLFAANYVRFTYQNHVVPTVGGVPAYAGPRDYPQQPNHLFRNRGDGTFADISAESGIAAHPGSGMGTLCLDYDHDGDTDIFVCNDQSWNFLFRNDGRGKFTEVALDAGVACNFNGEPVAGMGADCGDYVHDNRLHLVMTDYGGEKPILFRNLGNGHFEDVAMRAGIAMGSIAYVKWGCGMVDLDNDGYKDIFIGCGRLQDSIPSGDRGDFEVRPVLFRNRGDGTFANVSDTSGDVARLGLVARGVAFDDLDNDGRIDVVVLNSRRPATVLKNESGTGNHWLQIRLCGVKTNRDGVGARVRVAAGDLSQVAEVHSGRGYQSHFGSRLHFGLGKRDRVDRVEVRWIGGGSDVVENVPVDRLLTITEGTSPRGL